MYDYEIGNLADNTKKSNIKNSAEMRAVHSEKVLEEYMLFPRDRHMMVKVYMGKYRQSPK